jgi:hypothetical protein
MSFQERFRDRITTITKEGIVGAIKLPGNPIVKPTASPNWQPTDKQPMKQSTCRNIHIEMKLTM